MSFKRLILEKEASAKNVWLKDRSGIDAHL